MNFKFTCYTKVKIFVCLKNQVISFVIVDLDLQTLKLRYN